MTVLPTANLYRELALGVQEDGAALELAHLDPHHRDLSSHSRAPVRLVLRRCPRLRRRSSRPTASPLLVYARL